MNDKGSSNSDRLPIKLIMPKQGEEGRVKGGGSPPEPFRPVDGNYRKNLSRQIQAIRDSVLPQAKQIGALPVRVKLIGKAVAKSHRPNQLFSDQTCPIVGAGSLGELFVKATAKGLSRLTSIVESDQSLQVKKELSCVETIEPITPAFRRKGVEPEDLLIKSPRSADGFMTRIRLFNFGAGEDQQRLVSNFIDTCSQRNIRISSFGYSQDSFVYGAECHTVEDVKALSKIIGVRSVGSMPRIRTLRPKTFNVKPLPKLLNRAEVVGDVPVVVVVDSGISDQNPDLETWVVGRESSVAPQYRNTDHGTFVAGLICWGSELNPDLPGIDNNPCAVFDLQVIPNFDPKKGDTESLLEQEFLISLDTALQEHANNYKVWNLSLGTDEVCSLDDFSEFAEQLDNLQEKYQVSFVISAGNYENLPLLDFPRKPDQLDRGRITTPADSVLGIAVGSVSHIDYQKDGTGEHCPSAFSRHGAGPNYVIKPDLVHYGGSCSIDGSHVAGVRSVISTGSAEDIGTSYSTPLVSRTLAQVYHQLTPTPSPVLARALLTHHARDPRTGQRVPDNEENFFGFGLPSPVPYCLECTPYSSTLIFDDTLRPGYYLEWDSFPYPTSLTRKGRFFGEIWMTVAFAPARGARWGSEYCETHIDAHFGVYRKQVSRKTGEISEPFVGLVPPEHINKGRLYELSQIKELRKWAPVRTYHGDLGKNGAAGNRWRLKVQLLTRHERDSAQANKPQPFSLIITISDPQRNAPVYDEMARIVRTRFQAQNLALRSVARIQGRSTT